MSHEPYPYKVVTQFAVSTSDEQCTPTAAALASSDSNEEKNDLIHCTNDTLL